MLILIRQNSQSGKRTTSWHLTQKKFLSRAYQNVHILKRIFGNLHGISQICTHSVESNKANNCSDRQQISQAFFPSKGNSTSTLDSMWLCAAIYFQKSTHRWSVNPAVDFLSRLGLKFTKKIRLETRQDIQTKHIEVTTSSSDAADEEQFLYTQADKNNDSEEQTLARKEQSKQNAEQWVANEEPSSLKTSVKEFTKIDRNTTLYSMNGIKANARIRLEQDFDLVLKNMKLKILAQPNDEVLMVTDSRYKNYKANEDRITLKYSPL